MPVNMKPDCTAEDEGVLSLRNFRYHKLEPNGTTDLPPPCKFANFTKSNDRLTAFTRSKSEQDFGTRATEYLPRVTFPHGAQSQGFIASTSARLRDCLFMDEFQLLRPSSSAQMFERQMCNPAEEEGGDEIVNAFATISELHLDKNTHTKPILIPCSQE